MNYSQNVGLHLLYKVSGPFIDNNYKNRFFLSKLWVRALDSLRFNHTKIYLLIFALYSKFFCLEKYIGFNQVSIDDNHHLSNVKLQTVFGLVAKHDSLVETNQQINNPSFNLKKIESRVTPLLEPITEIKISNFTTASTCAPYNYYHFITDYIIPFISLKNYHNKFLYLPFYPNKRQFEILKELNITYVHSKFQANVFFHNLEILPSVFESSTIKSDLNKYKFVQKIIIEARETLVSVAGNNSLRIFCSRKNNSREPNTMIEIEKFFSDKGFFVYNSDEIPFKEAKDLFMQAKLIIGIHGAGLTNVIFAPSTCKMIELAPAKFKNKDTAADCFQELCIACNIQYLKYEFSNGIELLGILNENFAGF
jgi:hypothetical protein